MSAQGSHRQAGMPVLQDVGADFAATSQDPVHIHSQLHTVPASENGGTTTVVTFTDTLGNPIEFATIDYVAQADAEGTSFIVQPFHCAVGTKSHILRSS